MKLSESGNRHYTDEEIERVIKDNLETGSSSYNKGGVVHTSYGRVMEQLKRERDEYKAETIESAELLVTQGLQIQRMRDCVLFFSSVIKSGEPWTEECAASIKRALAKEWTDE